MRMAECCPDKKYHCKGKCYRCYMREYQRARLGLSPRKPAAPIEVRKARKSAYERQRYYADLESTRAGRRESGRRWRAAHPETVRAATHRRRARMRDGVSPGVTVDEWSEIVAAFDGKCAYCRRARKLTRDHVVPISKGGRDEPSNVVPACFSCNASKGAKPLAEFLQRVGDSL